MSVIVWPSPSTVPSDTNWVRQLQHGQTTHLTGEWTLSKNLNDDSAKAMETMHREGRGGPGHSPWMHDGGSREVTLKRVYDRERVR